MGVTIVIPTFNERGNVAEIVRRITGAMRGTETEILFVDDSTDGTHHVEPANADVEAKLRELSLI